MKCSCGYPMEMNRWGTFWSHVKALKGQKCAITNNPVRKSDFEELLKSALPQEIIENISTCVETIFQCKLCKLELSLYPGGLAHLHKVFEIKDCQTFPYEN